MAGSTYSYTAMVLEGTPDSPDAEQEHEDRDEDENEDLRPSSGPKALSSISNIFSMFQMLY